MKLIDKAVRALALRWAKGKMDGARKEGSTVLKALDGQKRLIVTIGFIVSGLVALATGQDLSQWLDLGLRALGWAEPDIVNGGRAIATKAAPLLFAAWAALHALWKFWKEHRAGATVAELGTTTAAVKQARAEGIIP